MNKQPNLSLQSTHISLSPSSRIAFSIVCGDVNVQLDSSAKCRDAKLKVKLILKRAVGYPSYSEYNRIQKDSQGLCAVSRFKFGSQRFG